MENITIIKADASHLVPCAAILADSDIGRVYFGTVQDIEETLRVGMESEEIYVAMSGGCCLGFFWFVYRGAFHSYPYLHMIAVDEASRGKGVGTKLLDCYEKLVLSEHSKTFLLVADFNPRAKKLYESRGWMQVGAIPGLYKPGVTEHLMVKFRPEPGQA